MGAGPKALALVSKNTVLRKLGFEVPEITIIEKTGVAAHWQGGSGYTNGKLPLGTSPEKDVGFPYASFCWGRANSTVNRMMQKYSWQNFLITQHRYADWVDRGKPAPFHKRWAEYLQWVYKKSSKEVRFILGEVTSLSLREGRWEIAYQLSNGDRAHEIADGVVLTGPGNIRMVEALPVDDRVVTFQQFWMHSKRYLSAQGAHIAVVGSGENAASVAVTLGQSESDLKIDIISPVAMNYTRGESYVENHLYSDPFQGNWFQLTLENRRDFIYRTDRGVFSTVTKAMLDQMESVEVIAGRLTQVEIDSLDQLLLTVEYDKAKEKRKYDYAVIATGFDPLGFLTHLLGDSTKEQILATTGLSSLDARIFDVGISESLALAGFKPNLHLPMLSAISQGPGFANLSCLGRLSDQILTAYVPLA